MSNYGVMGAASAGVIAEMLGQGTMDAYLKEQPADTAVSFWRNRTNKHTNFAMEPIMQPVAASFGGTAQVMLARAGDLIYHMYAVFKLPALYACPSSGGSSLCSGSAPGRYPYLVIDQANEYGYQTAAQMQDDAYFQTYTGHLPAWSQANYGNPTPREYPDAFSDTASYREEFFTESSGGTVTPNAWVHWHNAVGQRLIKSATIVLGGHQHDSLTYNYLYAWEELSGKAGKMLTEMIGKRTSRRQLVEDAKEEQLLYVPLPFYFTLISGNALPIISIQSQGAQLMLEFESLDRLIVASASDVRVVKARDGTPLVSTDLIAYIESTYVFLGEPERIKFLTHNFDQLATQTRELHVQAKGSSVTVNLNLSHPVIELIFMARRQVNEQSNDWFNYSGILGRDPIVEVVLRFNHQARFSVHNAKYFRTVQPYQFHSHIPDAHIYCWSFALEPEAMSPTGSANFSRLENAEMFLKFQDGLQDETMTVILIARNWQILRYVEGVVGDLFH